MNAPYRFEILESRSWPDLQFGVYNAPAESEHGFISVQTPPEEKEHMYYSQDPLFFALFSISFTASSRSLYARKSRSWPPQKFEAHSIYSQFRERTLKGELHPSILLKVW